MYCHECHELVNDMDVCCYKCGRSYCSECGQGYDPLSRTCLLYAHANVFLKPSFTVAQIKQYKKDIPYLVKPENIQEHMDFIKEIIENCYSLHVPEEEELSEEYNELFKRFLSPDDYVQELDFKCYDCKFPPVTQLFVIESDIQFYVNIRSAVHAATNLEKGTKILVYDLIKTEYKFVINDKIFYTVFPDKLFEHCYDDVIQNFVTTPIQLISGVRTSDNNNSE